jgi:hypothetical protein
MVTHVQIKIFLNSLRIYPRSAPPPCPSQLRVSPLQKIREKSLFEKKSSEAFLSSTMQLQVALWIYLV